jgi:hypothetical protein
VRVASGTTIERNSPSISPNSFFKSTILESFGSCGRSDKMIEVFPAPRKPVKTVIGMLREVDIE